VGGVQEEHLLAWVAGMSPVIEFAHGGIILVKTAVTFITGSSSTAAS
jgi:hypothetical protein